MSEDTNDVATTWEKVKAKREASRGPIPPAEVARAHSDTQAAITGWNLKELRKKAELTQVQVADRIGVAQRTVSSLENGDINKSGLPTISAYVTAIGGTLDVTVTLNGQAHHIAGDTTQAA